jgi:hypothetical protein
MPARVLTGPEMAAIDGPVHASAIATAIPIDAVIRFMDVLRILLAGAEPLAWRIWHDPEARA